MWCQWKLMLKCHHFPHWKTKSDKGMVNKSGWMWRAYLHMHGYVYILHMTSYTRQTCPSQVWWTTLWNPLAPGPLQEAPSPLKESLVISLPWGKAHQEWACVLQPHVCAGKWKEHRNQHDLTWQRAANSLAAACPSLLITLLKQLWRFCLPVSFSSCMLVHEYIKQH